jgi:hypothetical protein
MGEQKDRGGSVPWQRDRRRFRLFFNPQGFCFEQKGAKEAKDSELLAPFASEFGARAKPA